MLAEYLNMKGELMNTNNFENDKLPEMRDENLETAANESVSDQNDNQLKSEDTHTPEENIESAEVESQATETEETAPKEEKEIDYDLETPDNGKNDENADDDVDETNVSETDEEELMPIEEIVQKLRDLNGEKNPQRTEFENLHHQYYRSLREETERQKAAFLASGGESIDFVAKDSEIYDEGKNLVQSIKDKRAAIYAKEEAEKEQNVVKKLAIIDQVKHLAESPSHEDFNKTYQEFRALQQQWREVKQVPHTKVNELWKEYQRHVEKFYDLVRINNEFREYDFKKNLELKTELCESAERLETEPDIVSAFHQLQNLHQEWRDIGPVSRKDREAIWERFKEASININKRYQDHFEGMKEKEEENLQAKKDLCEKLEAIDYSRLNTIREWNNKLKEVLSIQKQWREIGYAPRKWNAKIYERYRAACDFFFRNKNEFYKTMQGEMDENLQKRLALIERAEELKDSTDWKKTTQEMIAIQKEWKTIGAVPRKHIDTTWKRFIAACDYFFEQKKKNTSSQHGEEIKNLELKREINESIKNIDTGLSVEEAHTQLRELMDRWYEIGHVPFKWKDRIYKEFYAVTEAQFDRLNINKSERKLDNFMSNISDMAKSDNARNQLLRERERLMRQYDRMKGELQTYENNLGFLSISSKKGNNLVDDINQKMKRIQTEIDLTVKKIAAIDEQLG